MYKLMYKRCYFKFIVPFALLGFLFVSANSQATIVRFTTSLGTIDVNLYDELTPITVANFLNYADSDTYTSTYIHRSVPGFIVQGGGYVYDESAGIAAVATDAAIANEPYYSNIRGTIAMAKLGGDPNSATSQWFFNLSNNALNLDLQNDGFTVFGEVMLDDMDVVDAIADLQVFDFGGAASNLPLRNYTADDASAGTLPDSNNYVLIESIEVVDSDVDTLAGELPTEAIEAEENDDSGGGASSMFVIGMLALLVGLRKAKLNRRGSAMS